MKTADFDYDLPERLIAQTPLERRDAARLLVLDRKDGSLEHKTFWEIGRYFRAGDVLVVNRTRVLPARLFGRKIPGGGRVELLLLKKLGPTTWEVWVGGKGLLAGRRVAVENGPEAHIQSVLDGPRRVVVFSEPIEAFWRRAGHVPLPPYIRAPLYEPERYQTVFAQEDGSAAAPTAGLHLTPRLLHDLQSLGVGLAEVTLHIGLDTFAPVSEENPEAHAIHTEWCRLDEQSALAINQARKNGGRIIAVGTTSVRTLETAARYASSGETVGEFEGSTDLFILPGYTFRAVDLLVTNFHLPKSTLVMLVSAFAGRETLLAAYETAKQAEYRFYSFGDAMLIL